MPQSQAELVKALVDAGGQDTGDAMRLMGEWEAQPPPEVVKQRPAAGLLPRRDTGAGGPWQAKTRYHTKD